MDRGVLIGLDTVGVQDYIFRTNELKQIVGASYLVDCATRQWLVDAISNLRHNVRDMNDAAQPFTGDRIEDGALDAEVFMTGGGNATIAFRDADQGRDFVYRLTKRLIIQAPGLQVAAAMVDFDMQNDAYGGPGGAAARLAKALDQAKMNLPRRAPQLGLSVTLQCDFTHLPAVAVMNGQPVSAEVLAKREAAPLAGARLKKLLTRIPEAEWEQHGITPDFPLQLDQLGPTEGEKSLLAVVHTDGNGMGKRFRAITEEKQEVGQNRELVEQLCALSISVQVASENALVETIRAVLRNIQRDPENGLPYLGDVIPLMTNMLPLRPILYGGDDATFLCDGGIGLSLAARYLEQVSAAPLADGKKLYSRAGVAIVKAHYPFARAYHLAEELAASAKQFGKQLLEELDKEKREVPEGLNLIDWHMSTSGMVRSLREIRDSEYTCGAGALNMRPLYLGELPAGNPRVGDEWRTWSTFEDILYGFDDWRDKRNKVKALRGALIRGGEAVKNFVSLNEKLPSTKALVDVGYRSSGWRGSRCVYFDVVEMVDLFVPLEEKENADLPVEN